jgi:tetratricopeptide (TPR) repeat protein
MTLLLALVLAAADPVAAYANLERARNGDAPGRLATVMRALNDARMPRSATVLLAALASDPAQSDDVRSAARSELLARAAQDPGLALLLLGQEGDPGKLPPALAVLLARGHLERALQLAPPEEGVAFEGLQQQSDRAAQPVSGDSAPAPLDGDLAAEMGEAAPQASAPAPAPARAEPPNQAQRELDRARALAASVPAGDPFAADAREVAGLSALAQGDLQGAGKEFLAIAQIVPRRGDKLAEQRRDKAYLQLARLAYAAGNDSAAAALYERVGRGAPEWLDALFEASWSRFRQGEDEKALGNLLTLHAPFFQNRFFPESFVLKALVMYENCRYADARASLAEFQQRYQAVHDGLADLLSRLPTPRAASDLILRGPVALQNSVPQAAREEVARVEQDSDVRGVAEAAAQLATEIDSIDGRPEPFRNSALVARVAPLARKARVQLLEVAGRRLISRLDAERAELRELLGQSLRLSFEIAGREKELAADPGSALAAQPHKDPPQVADDEEIWPFQGEYWRDELGSYTYQLGQRCKKPRAPLQTASQPQPPPEQVAAQPKR